MNIVSQMRSDALEEVKGEKWFWCACNYFIGTELIESSDGDWQVNLGINSKLCLGDRQNSKNAIVRQSKRRGLCAEVSRTKSK
jgi:hypothetical protein